MDTPIFDFVQNYIKSNSARLHMPGHKGVSFLGPEAFDITEIKGADELYAPDGIIRKSEENATRLFGTAKTIYSAGGSSQSINAMLYLAYIRADKSQRPFVLSGRNAHKSFIYALAKLDADVQWLYPERTQSLCSSLITTGQLRDTLKNLNRKPFAIYITSPDYLGKVANIPELSKVCKEYNIPLLVDNAHGSYLKFCPQDLHPISLGADMCCDSAHKTLPVLTGGGYLHIAKDDKYGFAKNAVNAMAIFGSTSPSYLILQSLDLCNKYIDEKIREDIKICKKKCEKLSQIMVEYGVWNTTIPQFYEPLKITADFSEYEGNFAEHFRKYGIEPEYSDEDYVVFMISPQNTDRDFEKLESALKNLKLTLKDDYDEDTISFVFGERVMTIREAIFSEFEETDVDNALGRVCATPAVSCPPAIPIAVSGEIITEKHLELFKKYNISKILVIKK